MDYTKHRAEQIIAVMSPLIEFWSVADDVFTTDEAMSQEHVYKTVGRLYRAWSEAKKEMDPDYDPERDRRPWKERSKITRRRTG